MNVLEFLKDMREDTPCEWVDLDRAIAELEEMMKPKTCYGCVHWTAPNDKFSSMNCYLLQRHTASDFSCKWYEPKDHQ